MSTRVSIPAFLLLAGGLFLIWTSAPARSAARIASNEAPECAREVGGAVVRRRLLRE